MTHTQTHHLPNLPLLLLSKVHYPFCWGVFSFSTYSERQFAVYPWWSQTDRPAKHCIKHKRVCFPWQHTQFCHINALPTAIVLDKWLCICRTGSTAKKEKKAFHVLHCIFWAFRKVEISANTGKFTSPGKQNYFTKLRLSTLALEERNTVQEKSATRWHKMELKRPRQTPQSQARHSKLVDKTVLHLCSLRFWFASFHNKINCGEEKATHAHLGTCLLLL